MKRQQKRTLGWAFALGFPLVLVWWIDRSIGWTTLLRPWTEISPTKLVMLVFLVAASYLTRALRLHDLYRPAHKRGFSVYLRVTVVHTAFLNVMPMRSGEVAFPIIMKRHFGESFASSIANLVWLRLADLWALLWLSAFLISAMKVSDLWLAVGIGAVMPVLAYVIRHQDWASEGKPQYLRWCFVFFNKVPESPLTMFRILAWTLATWSLKLSAFIALASNFYEGPIVELIPGIVAAELSTALPLQGFAGFGTYAAAMALTGPLIGVDVAALVAVGVNLHLFILGCTLLFYVMALLVPNPKPCER